METESLLLLATAFAIVFAALSAWLVRVAPLADLEAYGLDEIATAYLFGGRARAKEIAFYHLLRDGWIKGDAAGVFTARFSDAPEEMIAFERELLKRIADEGGVTMQTLSRLDLKGFKDVERRLLRKRLIVEFERLPSYNLMARIPIGLSLLFAIKMAGESWIRHETFIVPVVAAAAGWMAIKILGWFFSHRTMAGDILFWHLEREILRRFQARNETDVHGHHYDRLWSLHDDVLTKGLRSMAGAAILPSAVDANVVIHRNPASELSYERELKSKT